jgi:microcystin degradation protein MlrC
MGGRPRVRGPSQAELDEQRRAREAAEQEREMLAAEKAETERMTIEEQRRLQQRRRGRRYGGRRSLLSPRDNPEMGVITKKETLGG